MKSIELLDQLFDQIDSVILSRQHPVTGLLPASTAVNTHGDYTDAWVRDNVYSIMCVWSLGLAYKKHGEKVRSDQLEQATIKLMRGLLESMMRQAPKVETFKQTLNPDDALHAKYDTATGLPVVADDAWGHLQIDATSLFLLMIAQMSGSGLRIIFTYSEVDFIQNLIYYIASAYRTPDFGIWERGNKINNGKTEINGSSLGMAKAALQALDGFNLFGKNGSPRAVVHTVADAISNARATLASLLPRESMSKEVDSALLSVIGFPAFAVGDETLVNKTRDKILATLGGDYGCKRFIWDGHQTVVEDSSRLYYEHSELANFENIESEWPLFFTFLYVDALMNENSVTAKHYREKIESLMVEVDGVGLIPELYYLPEENIAAEKKNPRSQKRVPNDNVPLVWSQSLYLTGLMLDEGLLDPDDIDPLRMRHRSTRFIQPQIALVVLAEDEEVKQTLVENGVIAESLDEIKPIGVISAPHLVDAYGQVGANSALGLTGRPLRRLQTLSSSQTYEINGQEFLCLSWIQGDEEDYRSYDAKRVAHKIEQEISHIRKHWLNTEVAVFTFMVEKRTCESPDAATLYKTLRDLQINNANERVGYAAAKLAVRASRSNELIIPNVCVTPISFSNVYRDKKLIDCMPENLNSVIQKFAEAYQHYMPNVDGVIADRANFDAVGRLVSGYSLETNVSDAGEFSVKQFLEVVYRVACQDNHWLTARLCFEVLNKSHGALADGLLLLGSRHLSVVIGTGESKISGLETFHDDKAILDAIDAVAESRVEKTLMQEVIAMIGSLVRTNPGLFDSLRSVYLHNLLELCALKENEKIDDLAALAPSEILGRIIDILQAQRKAFNQGIEFIFQQKDGDRSFLSAEAEKAHALDTDWLEWRSVRGMIPRFDEELLKAIWQSFSHADQMLFGDQASEASILDCSLATSSMTPGEESFARLIDEHVQLAHPPYYKSAIVETLYAFTQFCQAHPDVKYYGALDLGFVLEKAAELYVEENSNKVAVERKLDVLLEKSPHVMQQYLLKAFTSIMK